MSRNEMEVLRGIMSDLKAGYTFGQDCTWDYYNNKPMRFPFFSSALYITPSGNIGWTHYGSSANKRNLKELAWIIEKIFDTTPSGFLRDYIRNDKSAITA